MRRSIKDSTEWNEEGGCTQKSYICNQMQAKGRCSSSHDDDDALMSLKIY